MARAKLGRFLLGYGGIGPVGGKISEYPLMDDDRSQYPYDLNSGYGAFSATTLFTSILAPVFVSAQPQGTVINYWFKPETLIITNKAGTTNEVILYDGQSASAGLRTMMDVILKASDTLFVGKDYLRGMYVVSGVFMSNLVSGLTVRVGGKLMQSIPAQL